MIWNFMRDFYPMFQKLLMFFSIFYLEKIPTDCLSNEFTVYRYNEVEILCGYYFGTDDEKRNEFTNKWNSIEFELISMRKK